MGINNHECRRLLSTTPTSKPKVAVVYYSMCARLARCYGSLVLGIVSRACLVRLRVSTPKSLVPQSISWYGHVRTLAVEEKKGLEAAGCEAILLQVPETLTEDILTKMGAPPKADDLIANPFELADYDGILFGVPTRFGMAAAQMKAFLDATGSLWQKGALYGKPAGIFFSTATLGGGQETTALTFLTQLSHHGMIYVPIGPSSPLIFDLTEPHGGSAYGAGTLAGPDGSRVPLELECKLAAHQGEQYFLAELYLTYEIRSLFR
eukprot:2124641-Pleurochrysis_carterae.AAC.1